MADRATDMSPWTVTHASNATTSDLFHFHLELLSEPTAAEGRRIIDCEGTAYLQAHLLGGETDIGGFISGAPATPHADSSAVATLINLEFDSALQTFDGFFLA